MATENSKHISPSDSRWGFLFQAVPAHGLGIFRIGFGLIMLWELFYLIRMNFVEIFLTGPDMLFHYDLLGWVMPLPEPLMWGLVGVLILCCILIILGQLYQPAMAVFALGFTYIFFIDKAYYNNHLYLLCLLSFMLIFVRADKALKPGKKPESQMVPIWMYRILQAQLVIVYFYGGIAKLNYDWLVRFEPVKTMLQNGFFMVDFLGETPTLWILSYGGMVFDLSIGFLLLIRRTRWVGVAGVLFFNISNSILFEDINIFPYFMIIATVLFLDPFWVKEKIVGKKDRKGTRFPEFQINQRLILILGIYFCFQLLFPFRHLLFEGNTDWTGEGKRFSWRMKVQTRKSEKVDFQILDYDKKVMYPVDMDAYKLNDDQRNLLVEDPAAVWQLSRFLQERGRRRLGTVHVGVKAEIIVSMNQRPSQLMINPDVDLTKENWRTFQHNHWIVPLQPLP